MLHFAPQKSTAIVEKAPCAVNRKMLWLSTVTPNFRRLFESGRIDRVTSRCAEAVNGRDSTPRRPPLGGMLDCRSVLMLQSRPHRIPVDRQDHALPAADERARGAARARARARRTSASRGARRAARPPDRDVQPAKRVPATVEFADIAGAGRTGGAQALLDVAAYRNADALLHVVRAFRDPSVPASRRVASIRRATCRRWKTS